RSREQHELRSSDRRWSSLLASILPSWCRLRTGLRRRSRTREIHLRYCPRSFRSLEISVVRLESCPTREQAVGKLLHVGVVVLQRVVVALAFDRNAIFGACQFIL